MKDRNVSILACLLLTLLALPAAATEVVVTDFDDGTTQGWTAVGADSFGTAAPGPSGLPGDRYLRFEDASNSGPNDALKLFAPSATVGALYGVAATCGTLELDFRLFVDDSREVTFRIDLQLDPDGHASGDPPQIAAIFRLPQGIRAIDDWVHVSVPLALGGPPPGWAMAAGSSPEQWDELLLGANLMSWPLDLGGFPFEIYGFDNVRLVTGDCPVPPEACLVPPRNLVTWFPLDDLEGDGGTVDIAGNTGGRRLGDREAGPGVVGGAFRFDGDDWVDGEDAPLLDFGPGQDFSIDFWIRTDDDSGLSVLLEKRDFAAAPIGWQVYLSNGSPGLQLATGSGPAICSFDPSSACSNWTSSLDVADGTWHFVAVTVDRDHPQGIRWYLDGLPTGPTFDPRVRNQDLSNDRGVRIAAGSSSGSNSPFLHFAGELDEIEVFRRALAPHEIQAIYNAGPAGKCDTSLIVPWDASIPCQNVEIQVCNQGSRQTETYDLAFAPLPQGTFAHPLYPCEVDGPTDFSMVAPTVPQVQVPPGACVTAEVAPSYPPGAAVGYGCYQVTATPRSGGRVLTRNGSVMVPTTVCCRPGVGVTEVPPFGTGVVAFDAINLTSVPQLFRYAIEVVDSEMEPDDSVVSLDGAEPGSPIEGEVALAPNQTVPIRVPVSLAEFETFNPFEVLLRDRDLPGPADVLTSQVVRSVGTGDCLEGPQTLCLAADRFQVSVAWGDFQGNDGAGQALPLTSDSGMFWFFHPANIELVVKVLDARAVNGHFWVFYGALSNVPYTIHVRDTDTGATRTYVNPSGTFASRGDTAAFPDGGAGGTSVVRGEDLLAGGGDAGGAWGMVQIPGDAVGAAPFASAASLERIAGAQGTCAPDATSFCLHGARFRVSSEWATTLGTSGVGQAIPLTSDTGGFWFFDQANVELVVKIIDGRTVNGNWWVFYGSLSNVEFTVTVEDTERGRVLNLFNPQGNFGSRGETELLDAP